MLHHLLVAHDLNPAADLALHRAACLAQREGARLSVVYVGHESMHHGAESHLRQQLSAYPALHTQIYCETGHVIHAIQTIASELPADLLVMGAHHITPLAPFAETTLASLLLECDLPVLLVAQETPEPWSTAVAAVDFSPAATQALQLAWSLITEGGTLHAVHVHEVAHLHAHDDETELGFQKSLFEALIADIQRHLAPHSVQFAAHWLLGERQHCLQHFIRQQQPALVALGIHPRSALSDTFVGGLWSEWLRVPPCTLLLVPHAPTR